MRLSVVPPYAALLALGFILLSVRVIRARRAARVALGSGADPELERRMRVQANFAEYVPLALLLLVMAESRGAWPWTLHVLCLALVIGRASHAWGVSRTPEVFRFRVAGMVTTFAVLAGGIALILVT